MTRLIALAPIDYSTGYGIDACQKLLGLIELGVNVFIRASRYKDSRVSPVPYAIQERIIHGPTDDEWELLIQPPWFCPTPGKKSIICTTLESTRTTPAGIANLQKMEAIIVPSEWNKQSMLEMGITKPIFVVPESIDDVFKFKKMRKRKTFVFGAAGNTAETEPLRKNLQMVVDAFLAAFPADKTVRLKIKTDPGTAIKTYTDPRIQVIACVLSPQELADWYCSLDLYISASRGESWDRMLHEAMACGRLVMILRGKEMTEALGKYMGLGWWHAINASEFEILMRHVRSLALEALLPVANDMKNAAVVYTRERCAQLLRDVLGQAGCPFLWPQSSSKKATRLSDEERIVSFYREQDEIPKLQLPPNFRYKSLTNTPKGIGDTMLLTPFPRLGTSVWSEADSFASLMHFNPEYRRGYIPMNVICADMLQKRYAMGNGHLIQRLHRVFNYEVPLKPKGYLVIPGIEKVKNRVAVHLLPGGHAEWQKRYIHPRAREMYDRSVKILQKFVRENGQYEWYEVGTKRSTWLNETRDKTGLGLCETIRFLQSCESFVGVISGPMHIAAALDCRCIVIINFPRADRIFLPTLKDIPQIESEWHLPQAVHLHQENDGPLVKRFTADNLKRAFDGQVYPYWNDRFLPLIHEKL